jgi:endonuclease/exonuclease/phosphatase (EEP) superfamily protein YafD
LATPRDGIEALMDKKLGGISAMKAVTKSQETESFHASEWAKKYDGGVVVGDFNLQTKNPIFQKYWSYFKDAFSKQGNGFGYTKYTRWHGVRIDHVLTDQRWKIVRAYVGDDVGSDHRPLIVDLVSLLPKTEEEAPKKAAKAAP